MSPSVIASTQMLRSPPKYLNSSFNRNYFFYNALTAALNCLPRSS
jgi:hypothetical protein